MTAARSEGFVLVGWIMMLDVYVFVYYSALPPVVNPSIGPCRSCEDNEENKERYVADDHKNADCDGTAPSDTEAEGGMCEVKANCYWSKAVSGQPRDIEYTEDEMEAAKKLVEEVRESSTRLSFCQSDLIHAPPPPTFLSTLSVSVSTSQGPLLRAS
jgi:hypothetical protein